MSVITKLENLRHRIALLIQYEGTRFRGWQIQKSGRTVQGDIEKALEIITKERTSVVASGRTDAGVHALGQVVHFDLSMDISLRQLCGSLNGILDNDVTIKNVYYVNSEFHARYSAVQREYLYLVYNHPQKSPFMKNRAMWVNTNIDIDILKSISQYLIGEMDFASFCKKISAEENTVRRIDEFEITKQNELIYFKIKGTAFLHNMIRIIIGTIIDIYKDKMPPGYIKNIIEKKDRDASGKTAPPYGLYLNHVFYNPPLSEMESAF